MSLRLKKLKIAIVVHGRFHAFDLARELLKRGHEVILFTNYPKYVAGKFGIPRINTRTFLLHGVLSKIGSFMERLLGVRFLEAFLHRLFGFWAKKELEKESWDVIHCWSGISEECLQYPKISRTLKFLMRGSSHIRTQSNILEEEMRRTGISIDRPSPWMIAREEREYALADKICVLSQFCRDTFIEQGISMQKLSILLLGAAREVFRPIECVVEERYARILSGQPLRVLYVGALSFRKGFFDMERILGRIDRNRFQFRFVGPCAHELREFLKRPSFCGTEIVPKQPQDQLPVHYAWADIFIFPTLEEGYPQVLAQAAVSGLPILTTLNGAGSDIVKNGKTGWILPIREPEKFVQCLNECDNQRRHLAEITRFIYQEFKPRYASDVAADFEKICTEELEKIRDSR